MELVRGKVSDRPFARSYFALAKKRLTGDLIVSDGGRTYKSSWQGGKVVAAESPAPADTPGRIALTAGLVTSTTLSKAIQEQSAAPERSLLEVLAQIARLGDKQVIGLKRRTLARSAARVFALPNAEFTVTNARSLSADPQVPAIDARWLIFFGLRTHYKIERLEAELAALGDRPVQLKPETAKMLSAFGFREGDRPVLVRIHRRPVALPELLETSGEVDRATVMAIVLTLLSCNGLAVGQPSARASAPTASTASAPSTSAPTVQARPLRVTGPHSVAMPDDNSASSASPSGPTPPRARSDSRSPAARARSASASPTVRDRPMSSAPPSGHGRDRLRRASASPPLARGTVTSAGSDSPAAEEVRALIRVKAEEVSRDADHFTVLNTERGASSDAVRTAYFKLAKKLHPDRLRALGVLDLQAEAQQVFAAINLAFSVLSDAKKAHEYQRVLAAGGEKAVKKAQAEAEDKAMKILAAEEHFRVGEMALRRNQFAKAKSEFQQAVDLSPDEGEYQAMLGWTIWCGADDKSSVADQVKKLLSSAILRAPKSPNVHLCQGRVFKQLGRREEALAAFQRVIDLSPGNHEAELEIRVLSSRAKRETEGKGRGLFGRKKP